MDSVFAFSPASVLLELGVCCLERLLVLVKTVQERVG